MPPSFCVSKKVFLLVKHVCFLHFLCIERKFGNQFDGSGNENTINEETTHSKIKFLLL